MSNKSVKELAEQIKAPVEKLLEQLVDAGLPARQADAQISEDEQAQLLNHLQRIHGQQPAEKKITLKRKTTSTAKVASTTGKAKTINVEVRKKHTFVKPDPAAIIAEAKQTVEAAKKATEPQKAATPISPVVEKVAVPEVKVAPKPVEKAVVAKVVPTTKPEAKVTESRVVRKDGSSVVSSATVIKATVVSPAAAQATTKTQETAKKKPTVKAAVKPAESAEERKAREAEEAKLKAAEEAARRSAAEEAQKRTLEQMRQMASKYNTESYVVQQVEDDTPLARGLVGRAYEESFAQEDREIKRGVSTTSSTGKVIKARKPGRGQEEQVLSRLGPKGLKTSQSNKHKFEKPVEKQIYNVEIGETIIVSDLAQKMAVKAREVIKTLMKMGEMVRENQPVDQATAALVVEEMGHNPILVSDSAVEDNLIAAVSKAQGVAKPRPPVVTIMGHVDHGKTSLLDYIRKAKVAAGEAGGITQHIGAYHVETDRGVITFLDTPGHAAFTAMRARGAKATDIVILVVAADDGVMPQTAEAIDHAKAAGTPLIVAMNKIDKQSADPDRVMNELTTKEIVPEEWGGDTPIAKVSAHTGEGIDNLLELILIQAELMELTASDEGAAQGVVIEARIDKGRGAVTSLLVQKGTLKAGDLVLAGQHYGRVRAMLDENGKPIKTAGPSIPVEILGLPEAPNAGDEFLVVSDDKKAREVADFRAERDRQTKLTKQAGMRLENIFAQMGKQEVPVVNVVLKTDVRGSLEAIIAALQDLATEDVRVAIVGSGVGAITESDVTLAESTGAVLLGFNVRADAGARRKVDQEGLDLRYYSVIYELIDDVKAAMSGLLAPEHRENILGIAQVRQVFRSSKFGAAAGCMVLEGTIYRNKPIRVLRDGVVVFQGELESLRRHKDDVNEVRAGTECGLAVRGYNDIREGDQIEVYEVQEIRRTL